MNMVFLAALAIAGIDQAAHESPTKAHEPFHLISIRNTDSGHGEILLDNKQINIDSLYNESLNIMNISGRSSRYAVIFFDKSDFSSVIDVNQILSSVGLSNVRYFVTSDGEYMTEIKFSHNFQYGNPYKRIMGGVDEDWPAK